jgi:LacI family transcriptional regulator
MRALAELRIACPGQISVLGFHDFVAGLDGFSWATLFSPQLTTVAQPSYEIGRTATQLLFSRIDASGKGTMEPDEPASPAVIRLRCGLRVSESTAPPPSGP